jgi:acetyl-CoA carboxylase biotin carboxylase subunit
LHVKFADEAVCIGKPQSADSYLNIPHIMAAAEITNADAVHPGYGFLAENAKFSQICADHGIKFIGPTPEMINKMGDKISAKETMIKAGVPVVPGGEGLLESVEEAISLAKVVGYPVILKATAGGGGKGMRVVWNEAEIEKAISESFVMEQHELDLKKKYFLEFKKNISNRKIVKLYRAERQWTLLLVQRLKELQQDK